MLPSSFFFLFFFFFLTQCYLFFMALHDQIMDFLVVGMDSRIFWLDFMVGLKQFVIENLSCPPCPHG